MKFNGAIIITDPCYFSTDEDWGNSISYEEMSIDNEKFSDYLMEYTGIGDGTWDVFSLNYTSKKSKLTSLLENIYEEEEYEDKLIGEPIGQISADSGITGVFYLSDVLEYNPEFSNELDKLKQDGCATVIDNFNGEVTPFFDSSSQLHFIGIGNNVSFYTV